jgi:hypothetical protein
MALPKVHSLCSGPLLIDFQENLLIKGWIITNEPKIRSKLYMIGIKFP